jgi:hypothetical protein
MFYWEDLGQWLLKIFSGLSFCTLLGVGAGLFGHFSLWNTNRLE